MENRKRNIQIKFRVTEEERTLIEEKMKQVPTSNMEAYLRKMAIDGYIIQIDHSDIKKMTAELQKIGVNINQIARRTNTTGNVYPEDIEEIKGALCFLLLLLSSFEIPLYQRLFRLLHHRYSDRYLQSRFFWHSFQVATFDW